MIKKLWKGKIDIFTMLVCAVIIAILLSVSVFSVVAGDGVADKFKNSSGEGRYFSDIVYFNSAQQENFDAEVEKIKAHFGELQASVYYAQDHVGYATSGQYSGNFNTYTYGDGYLSMHLSQLREGKYIEDAEAIDGRVPVLVSDNGSFKLGDKVELSLNIKIDGDEKVNRAVGAYVVGIVSNDIRGCGVDEDIEQDLNNLTKPSFLLKDAYEIMKEKNPARAISVENKKAVCVRAKNIAEWSDAQLKVKELGDEYVVDTMFRQSTLKEAVYTNLTIAENMGIYSLIAVIFLTLGAVLLQVKQTHSNEYGLKGLLIKNAIFTAVSLVLSVGFYYLLTLINGMMNFEAGLMNGIAIDFSIGYLGVALIPLAVGIVAVAINAIRRVIGRNKINEVDIQRDDDLNAIEVDAKHESL